MFHLLAVCPIPGGGENAGAGGAPRAGLGLGPPGALNGEGAPDIGKPAGKPPGGGNGNPPGILGGGIPPGLAVPLGAGKGGKGMPRPPGAIQQVRAVDR